MNNPPNIVPYGDTGLLLQFEATGYDQDVIELIQSLGRAFRSEKIWTEVVPAYDSLLLGFNPLILDPVSAQAKCQTTLTKFKPGKAKPGRTVEIPVYYGGDDGPDMDVIMTSSGLSEAEIIKLHSAPTYLVCMMGFVPGFTFLSEAHEKLHHPRRLTPRDSVPAGSVGIAGWQTGIYGLDTPGGWQIIGRTDVKLFDPNRDTPFYLEAGDRVKFVPTQRAAP